MKRFVCTVKDLASQLFGQPIFVPAVAQAVRGFRDEVAREAPPEQNPLHAHPEDFELWCLAIYDDESGRFECPADYPQLVVRGKDVQRV